MCNTSQVVRYASALEFMDSTVKPCDDFYKYSCNGFIRKNPIPALDSLQTGVLTNLMDTRVNTLTRILNGDLLPELSNLLASNPDIKLAYQTLRKYYTSCTAALTVSVDTLAQTDYSHTQLAASIADAEFVAKSWIQSEILSLNNSATDFLWKVQSRVVLHSTTSAAQLRGIGSGGSGLAFPTWLFDVAIYSRYIPGARPVLALVPQGASNVAAYEDVTIKTAYRNTIARNLKDYVYTTATLAGTTTIADAIVAFEEQYLQILESRPTDFNETWPAYTASQLDAQYPNVMRVTGTSVVGR